MVGGLGALALPPELEKTIRRFKPPGLQDFGGCFLILWLPSFVYLGFVPRFK